MRRKTYTATVDIDIEDIIDNMTDEDLAEIGHAGTDAADIEALAIAIHRGDTDQVMEMAAAVCREFGVFVYPPLTPNRAA